MNVNQVVGQDKKQIGTQFFEKVSDIKLMANDSRTSSVSLSLLLPLRSFIFQTVTNLKKSKAKTQKLTTFS